MPRELQWFCCYLREQGFTHTYFGQPYTYFWFPNEVHEVRERDPEAKIVLVGFSWGANYVRSMAHRLADDGIPVDLLVYLVGDTIWNMPDSRPPNVRRVVNVRGRGLILLGGLCDVPTWTGLATSGWTVPTHPRPEPQGDGGTYDGGTVSPGLPAAGLPPIPAGRAMILFANPLLARSTSIMFSLP